MSTAPAFPPMRRASGPPRPARRRAGRGPEDDFVAWIIRTAKSAGWRVVHFRPARLADGRYRTAIEGDAGFVDLVLARDGIVLHRECKTDTGAVTAEQRDWLAHLGDLGGVWRPRDHDRIEAELLAPRPAVRARTIAEERHRVVRHFDKYTPEQRATRAASHRLTPDQQRAIGEYVYTHPDVPGRCYTTRDRAARAGVAAAAS